MSDFVKGKNVPDKNVGDTISRQTAIDEMQEYWRALNLRRRRIPLAAEAVYMDLKGVVATLPSAEPNRIARETAGKSPDEIYDFLYWLMSVYGMQFTDSRAAVIEWLKEERREDG